MPQGMLIVCEGGEGVGKTTQVKRLREFLPGAFPGRAFVFTREPGGTALADAIRALIMSDMGKEANDFALMALFLAARADHVEKVIAPALARGDVVICDRYLATTYAYQVRAVHEDRLEELFWAHAKLVPLPNAILFFDLDPRAARERVLARTGERNHLDDRSMDFHARIGDGFEAYFRAVPEVSLAHINAAGSEEEVWGEVKAAVTAKLQPVHESHNAVAVQ